MNKGLRQMVTYAEWASQKIPSMKCTKNKGMEFHCNRSFNILCLNCFSDYAKQYWNEILEGVGDLNGIESRGLRH